MKMERACSSAMIALAIACGGDDTTAADTDTTGDAGSSSDSTTGMPTSSATSASTSTSSATDEDGSSSSSGEATSSSSGEVTSSGSDTDETTTAESSTGDESSSSSSTGTGTLDCTVHADLDAVPRLLIQPLVEDQGFEGSCGEPGVPEAVFSFTAPADGEYHFDALTLHSVANAVLYAIADCGGEELDCARAEYFDETYAAVVSLELDAGETILLVAESNYDNMQFESPDEVEVVVMGGPSCPAADLGSTVPQQVSGSLAGVPNAYVPACNAQSSANDAGFLFTAPADGGYRFTAFEAGDTNWPVPLFATAATCNGEQVGCATAGYGESASIALRMAAGETTAVFATESYSYSDVHFDLFVDPIEIPACPLADVPSAVPQTVSSTTFDTGNDYSPSCGGSFGSDAEFTFTAPNDGTFVFASDSYEVWPIMSVLDGTCGGAELGCHNPGDFVGEPGLLVDLVSGQSVTVVVDDDRGMAGAFDLVVEQQQGDCVDEDIGVLAAPFDLVGTTSGATNSSAASCAGLRAPDYGFLWTAPAAGDYAISTIGSSIAAAVSVRDAGCDGAELACNPGWVGGIVNVSLAANQTVVIAVEARAAEAGDFVVHVEEQQPLGDCCEAGFDGGCENALVEACVCAFNVFCCEYWDSYCVDTVAYCGGGC